MNILVVTGSPRKGSNTDLMAAAFAEGAQEAGHGVTVRHLHEHKVGPCLACEYCFAHDGMCVQKDDMNALLDDVDAADALVVASPIYWFDVSAQSKCFIDRLYARAVKGFSVKAFGMLLDSGSDGVYGAARQQLADICSYLNWENKGAFEAPGMEGRGSIKDTPYLDGAREFGRAF